MPAMTSNIFDGERTLGIDTLIGAEALDTAWQFEMEACPVLWR